jgi:hypothetical protein
VKLVNIQLAFLKLNWSTILWVMSLPSLIRKHREMALFIGISIVMCIMVNLKLQFWKVAFDEKRQLRKAIIVYVLPIFWKTQMLLHGCKVVSTCSHSCCYHKKARRVCYKLIGTWQIQRAAKFVWRSP